MNNVELSNKENNMLISQELEQAINDAQAHFTEYGLKARLWFASDRTEIGSFLWVCSMLNFDPELFRDICETSEIKFKRSCA